MNLVDNLTDSPNQTTTLNLDDGSSAVVIFSYKPSIQRWIIDLTWGVFSINGFELCVHPNVLRDWRRILPFGIMVVSRDGVDPIYADDFSTGRVQLYILNKSDVASAEAQVAAS